MDDDSTWKKFIGGPDTRGELLAQARNALQQKQEESVAMKDQMELMAAMLKAAEEELKVRSDQLSPSGLSLRFLPLFFFAA